MSNEHLTTQAAYDSPLNLAATADRPALLDDPYTREVRAILRRRILYGAAGFIVAMYFVGWPKVRLYPADDQSTFALRYRFTSFYSRNLHVYRFPKALMPRATDTAIGALQFGTETIPEHPNQIVSFLRPAAVPSSPATVLRAITLSEGSKEGIVDASAVAAGTLAHVAPPLAPWRRAYRFARSFFPSSLTHAPVLDTNDCVVQYNRLLFRFVRFSALQQTTVSASVPLSAIGPDAAAAVTNRRIALGQASDGPDSRGGEARPPLLGFDLICRLSFRNELMHARAWGHIADEGRPMLDHVAEDVVKQWSLEHATRIADVPGTSRSRDTEAVDTMKREILTRIHERTKSRILLEDMDWALVPRYATQSAHAEVHATMPFGDALYHGGRPPGKASYYGDESSTFETLAEATEREQRAASEARPMSADWQW